MNLSKIATEQRNIRSEHIDEMTTLDMLKLINDEDKLVAVAVEKELPQIVEAVEVIGDHIKQGGRLFYIGAGTSGRIGVLDASECPPTYSTEPSLVQGLIAGGENAMFRAVEGAEDNLELGKTDLISREFNRMDVLVGLAASGRTPYVIGAMEYAHKIGAVTVAVTCCKGSEIDNMADIGIAPMPGPEVVTGSTRMKSGTAEKMVLNMISTGVMIRLGKVYGNLMVDVKPSNEKLIKRTISIVMTATGVDADTAERALEQCGHSPKIAIVMIKTGLGVREACDRLNLANGVISKVINS